MRCNYCGSAKVVNDNGEWVCSECGTVLGYELVAYVSPNAVIIAKKSHYNILKNLEDKNKINIKKLYKELVEKYLKILDAEFGTSYTETALRLIDRISKAAYQGKTPRVVAATLYYLVADMRGTHIDKSRIAGVVKISKHSIRDTASRIKKYVQ